MTGTPRPGFRHRLALGLGLLAVLGLAGPAPAAAATDRQPDMHAAYIKDFHIVNSGGRRLLRFTGMMWNGGAGPLEIRARRTDRSSPWHVDQIVYNSDGGYRRIPTAATMRYAGDGHDHWHVRSMLTISKGCGPRSFCPTRDVTRGQLAAMLHRSIVPPAP